jgi:hypothetical protein
MGNEAAQPLLTGRRHHCPMARTQRKAVARRGSDAPPAAKQLTASMRVTRSHQHRPSLTVQDAPEAIKEAALNAATGAPGPETQALVTKLEPGKNWFAYFRFYQPTEAYFDRSWPLPDFEPIYTVAKPGCRQDEAMNLLRRQLGVQLVTAAMLLAP